jgi:hypothetical protein
VHAPLGVLQCTRPRQGGAGLAAAAPPVAGPLRVLTLRRTGDGAPESPAVPSRVGGPGRPRGVEYSMAGGDTDEDDDAGPADGDLAMLELPSQLPAGLLALPRPVAGPSGGAVSIDSAGNLVAAAATPAGGAGAAAGPGASTASQAHQVEPHVLRLEAACFELITPAHGPLTLPLLAPPGPGPDIAVPSSPFVKLSDGSVLYPGNATAAGSGPSGPAQRATAGGSAAVATAGATTFDTWFPQGDAGGFFSRGLAQWQQQRAAWRARPPGYAHPPYPPDAVEDYDDLLEDLIDVEPFELPGPMRLPDVIDLYQEVWSPISASSDPW